MPTPERLTHLQHPTRRRMLDAAESCFARTGYDAARVDDIAATAGVSKSHLYYHFASKQELMAGLVDLRVGEALEAKERLFGDGEAEPAATDDERLRATLTSAVTGLLLPHRDFIRVAMVEAIQHPEVAAPVFEALGELLDDTVRRLTATHPHLNTERLRRFIFHFLLMPTLMAAAVDEDTLLPGLGMDSLLMELPSMERALLGLCDDQPPPPGRPEAQDEGAASRSAKTRRSQ